MLTSRALVKSYLGETGTGLDSIIDTLVAAVDARMLAYLGRTRIESGSVANEYHDGDSRRELVLREWPVSAVGEVAWWDGTTATALAASDYALDGDRGILLYTPSGGSPSVWRSGLRNIRVSYTAGYSTVPKDLEFAATVQTVWDLKRRGTNPGGGRLGERQSIIGEATAIYMVDEWAPEALETMRRYRRVPV